MLFKIEIMRDKTSLKYLSFYRFFRASTVTQLATQLFNLAQKFNTQRSCVMLYLSLVDFKSLIISKTYF